MKATGRIMGTPYGNLWYATMSWIQAGAVVMDGENHTKIETAYYSTVQKALKAAEKYAKALGLEIEWGVTR